MRGLVVVVGLLVACGGGGGGDAADSGPIDAGATIDAAPGDPDAAGEPDGDGGPQLTILGHAPLPASMRGFGVPAPTLEAFVVSPTQISVVFPVAVDEATAETLANYSIAGLAIESAFRLAAPNDDRVLLTTARQTAGQTYAVSFSGVEPLGGGSPYGGELIVTGRGFDVVALASFYDIPVREVWVSFNEPVACSALADEAQFTIAGRQIVNAKFFGACNTTQQSVQLVLDRPLGAGEHTLVLGPAVKNALGEAPVNAPVSFQGPGAPVDGLWMRRAVADSPNTIVIDLNDLVDPSSVQAEDLTITPPLTVNGVTVLLGRLAVFTSPQEANVVYTISASGITPEGGGAEISARPVAAWGFGSFVLTEAYAFDATSAELWFSATPAAGADSAASYGVDGGASVTGASVSVNGDVSLVLAGASAGREYRLSVGAAVVDDADRGLATFYGGETLVTLSEPAASIGAVRLDGEDVTASYRSYLGVDGKTVHVLTGPRPPGATFTLTIDDVVPASGDPAVQLSAPLVIPATP